MIYRLISRQPVTYLQHLSAKFCNRDLLKEAFGSDHNKILDLLSKVDIGMRLLLANQITDELDLAVMLLYVYASDNPDIVTAFKSHAISNHYFS